MTENHIVFTLWTSIIIIVRKEVKRKHPNIVGPTMIRLLMTMAVIFNSEHCYIQKFGLSTELIM